jgi:hypothetical protein
MLERFNKLKDVISYLSLIEVFCNLWKVGQRAILRFAVEGMYEVVEYESTLELKDPEGKKAIFHKREKVLYLQDNIIAYQDQAWGDGKILQNYRCIPGIPVDFYRPGRKTYILISLREVKNQGDVEEFNIEWRITEGFVRTKEIWETEIRHRTRRLKIQVVFPKERPPTKVSLYEDTQQRTLSIDGDDKTRLPDGRWVISLEKSHPKVNEIYTIKWDW